ncbi:MAG: recombination protein RecR [Bacteriovoracaceae bacterium]|nr:recombination protein RecR [Bacteriovoracaceae bacterium]
MDLPEKLQDAVLNISKLPGIGNKTALRHALYLSKLSGKDLERFGDSFKNLQYLQKCTKCGMFTDDNKLLCDVCSSPVRSSSNVICVVETIIDCLAVEKSGQYDGKYHILGGVLNPLLGIGPDELKIEKFISRVFEENINEVILGLNPSVEGDATCSYIKQRLEENGKEQVEVSRIGFGIPMGGSLEYLDSMTINKALENKKRI